VYDLKRLMFGKQQPKIFIVEDNDNNHPLFSNVFAAAGFQVAITPYVDERFIEDVVAIKPDIISMDIMLASPHGEFVKDGLSAIALLKSDERTQDIPVMVLTNFFEETKVERAKQAGAVDFINLQGHSISTIPKIFKHYLDKPKDYVPVHPFFRKG
jgi:CheY-like chemotaxis protein